MSKEEIIEAIGKYISGQGNQAGLEKLGEILSAIVDLIPDEA